MSRVGLGSWFAVVAVCGGMGLFLPGHARAGVLGGCNYSLSGYSDRGSVQIFNRDGTVTMQMVIDGGQSVYSNLKVAHSTGDQAREEGRVNTNFGKQMADAHIFPTDIRSLDVYLAPPDASGTGPVSTQPAASYYAFYGEQGVFLGGFGTIYGEWYCCDWQ